jgi:fatty acid desaturase
MVKGAVMTSRVPIVSKDSPPFTLSQLHAAIPAHCWERPLHKSMFFLARDLASIALLYYFAWAVKLQGVLAWTFFGLVIGTLYFGVWILGHESGHRAFSDVIWINDAVGMFCHSVLLTPYHSWRLTHAQHHAATGHVTADTAFAPDDIHVGKALKSKLEMLKETPIYNLWYLFWMLVVGMFFYLGWNAGGQQRSGQFNCMV